MKEKTIYELNLHEEISINKFLHIRRVPGGWIYKWDNSTTFIPYDTEFKNSNVI